MGICANPLSLGMQRRTLILRAVIFAPVAALSLCSTQAKADNNGVVVTVYDNSTPDNAYNNAPPLPPVTPIAGTTVLPTVEHYFDQEPLYGLYDDFVVRFDGHITTQWTGTVYFLAQADDGVQMFVNGNQIINDWWDKGGGGNQSVGVDFVQGQSQPFTLWFYENGGGAWIQLWWLVDNEWQIVPAEAFSQSETSPTTSLVPQTTVPASSSVPPQTTTTTTVAPVPSSTTTSSTTLLATSTTTSLAPIVSTTEMPAITTVVETTTTTTTVPDTARAEDIIIDPAAVASLDGDTADELFASLDLETLSDSQLQQLVSAVQDAPVAVRKSFERTINVFNGQTDSYVPLGSTVPISTRRLIVAATTMLGAVPVVSRKQR